MRRSRAEPYKKRCKLEKLIVFYKLLTVNKRRRFNTLKRTSRPGLKMAIIEEALAILLISNMAATSTGSFLTETGQFLTRRYARSHPSDLVLGTPTNEDSLLLNVTVERAGSTERVTYDDLAFDERSYINDTSIIKHDCPYNITAISITHQGSEGTAGYPIILLGGLGAPEVLILFVSQKGIGFNFQVKIWGRPYAMLNANSNLIYGFPEPTDELLLFTNIMQSGQMGESVIGTVIYEKPPNKEVNITSVQAWDVSKGCKLGGYPLVIAGGPGQNNVKVQITSAKFRGFQYHILVFGKVKSILVNEPADDDLTGIAPEPRK